MMTQTACSPELRRFGDELKEFLETDEALRLITGFCVTGQGWTSGVCGILADGIAKWLGSDVQLWGIWGTVPERSPFRGKVQAFGHVVVKVDGCFLDADGASTEAELLERWGSQIEDARLKRFPRKRPSGIPWHPTTARRIARLLEARFGPGKERER